MLPPEDPGLGSATPSPRGDGVDVPALFRAGSPRAVLALLMKDDPLELRARCSERIRRQALIMDGDRLHLRVAARVAHAADLYAGKQDLGVWIAERLRVSLRELLEDDEAAARHGVPIDPVKEAHLHYLVRGLGVEVDQARNGVVAFNTATFAVREAFMGVLVDGRGIGGHAKVCGSSSEQVRLDLRRALRALGTPPGFDISAFEGGG